jgi:hypothetical protein
MARKRSAAKTEEGQKDAASLTLSLPVRRPGPKTSDRDPREPLQSGAIEDADQQEVLPPEAPQSRRTAEDLATRYARSLIANKHLAPDEQIVAALTDVFGVSPLEAQARMVELHERARGATRANTSIGDMFERHDLTVEVRLARLREMLFSTDPRVAIRAIEQLNEMDATSKSKRIGTTWETFARKARERARERLAGAK